MRRAYIASPFFNDRELSQVEGIKRILVDLGFEFYSPKDDAGILLPDATPQQRAAVVEENRRAIRDCDFVVCNTARKDIGSVWEAGYADGVGKPVVYFAEGLPGLFNVMLSETGIAVCTDLDDLRSYLRSIFPARRRYHGSIQ